MSDKFQNKYRIPSARWQNWDYRWSGAYFITICTKNRIPYFGKIYNYKLQLTGAGILADVFWHEIKNHTQNVELGEFVVMPNHIHGILILNNENIYNHNENGIGDGDMDGDGDGFGFGIVETGHALSLPQPQTNTNQTKTIGQQRFQNIGNNSISSIIGSYKSAVKKHTNRLGIAMEWQERYHDHVIRNENEYVRIAEYIKNNPSKWISDKFYS